MVDLRDEPKTATSGSRATLGVPQAVVLIVGSIIGVGIFDLLFAGVHRPHQPRRDGFRDARRARPRPDVRIHGGAGGIRQHRRLLPLECRRLLGYLRDRQRQGDRPVPPPPIETEAVAAAKVRDPEHNVPRATIHGTLGRVLVHLLSLPAGFGIVPTAERARNGNSALYSVAANTMFGGRWWGYPIAATKGGHLPEVFSGHRCP